MHFQYFWFAKGTGTNRTNNLDPKIKTLKSRIRKTVTTLFISYHHIKIKKPKVHFIIKIFLIENECKTPSFSDEMDLRSFILMWRYVPLTEVHVRSYGNCVGVQKNKFSGKNCTRFREKQQ